MDNCIFCKIVRGEIDSYKIYEDEYTFAFLDISNDANGHILVIPKEHCTNILDCDDTTLARVIQTVKKISQHLTEECGFGGVNVINASGKDAEQSVFHLHFHILPRKAEDNMHVFPDLVKNEKTLAQLQKELSLNKE